MVRAGGGVARKTDSSDGGPKSLWDWFLLGAFAGVMVQMVRNPGSVACCGCLAVILVIILGIVAWFLIAEYYIWILLFALVVFGARWWVRYSARKKAERDGF
jgi:hypothetical protein